MYNVIVFSKHRAMQLDLFLTSMNKYAERLWPPTVIYACTNNFFCESYEIIKRAYPDVRWEPQTPEAPNLKSLIMRNVDRSKSLTTFFVDDDVFYRPLSLGLQQWLQTMHLFNDAWAYAPRLGYNCTYCYNGRRPQKVPKQFWREVGDPDINGDGDFDCTMSVDGHMYKTDWIMPYLDKIQINYPYDIENSLYAEVRCGLSFAEHSCLVGIPHNLVGPNWANRSAAGSVDNLNQMYLDGMRIDIDKMDFSNVIGVHQEIPYVFSKP